MADKKYVPQGVYLACDKGTTPTEFKITNNNNVFLFEEPVANTGDMAPNLNVMPFGACSVKNGSACMPVPTSWQGFEDGIFIGNFNPLLEDSILPCGLGGKIEIFYSLEEAETACDDGGMSFWEIVGAAVLVVAAVALIVVTGGAVLAAVAAVGAASGALATTVAVGVLALEATGLYFEVKALIDYSQDGDEEALFKGVALGFLFLGAGKLVGKGFDRLMKNEAVTESIEAVTKKISKRLEYLGKNPGKASRTGREVFDRMLNGDPPTARYGRGGKKEFWDPDNEVWRDIAEADMGHMEDAVTWWNNTGREFGPKSKEVRDWMLDSDNYALEYFRTNRSKGAILGKTTTYLPPSN